MSSGPLEAHLLGVEGHWAVSASVESLEGRCSALPAHVLPPVDQLPDRADGASLPASLTTLKGSSWVADIS
eukprot:84843-Pyramimonas_sp.AAC.1